MTVKRMMAASEINPLGEIDFANFTTAIYPSYVSIACSYWHIARSYMGIASSYVSSLIASGLFPQRAYRSLE